jgi:hypothetical protein
MPIQSTTAKKAMSLTPSAVVPSTQVANNPLGDGAILETIDAIFARTVAPETYNAVGDGTANDYAAMVEALAAGAGKTLILTPGKTYRCNTYLSLPSNITIIGHGAKIATGDSGVFTPAIDVQGKTNITIAGLEIDGRKSAWGGVTTEQKHGLRILDSSHITLRDLYIHDCKGDGVYVGASSSSGHCVGVVGSNLRCDSNYRQGMSITDLRHGVFTACEFTNTAGTAPAAGVDVEPNYTQSIAEDLVFVGCLFAGNAGAGFQGQIGTTTTGAQENWRLIGCTVRDNGTNGIALTQCKKVTIDACAVYNNTIDGINITDNSRSIHIVGGECRDNGAHGIYAIAAFNTKFCTDLQIIGVQVYNNSTTTPNTIDGIRLDWQLGATNGLEALIQGCAIDAGGMANQRYSLTTSPNINNLRLIGNRISTSTTGTVVLSDDAATRICKGNIGIADTGSVAAHTHPESDITNLTSDLAGKQPVDATLTALAAYNTAGLLTQTAADTFAGRTLAGTANQITVVNGDGVAGNPTVSLPTSVTISGAATTSATVQPTRTSGVGGIVANFGDSVAANGNSWLYSYVPGASGGAKAAFGLNYYYDASGTGQRLNTSKNAYVFILDTTASADPTMSLSSISSAGTLVSLLTFTSDGNACTFPGSLTVSGTINCAAMRPTTAATMVLANRAFTAAGTVATFGAATHTNASGVLNVLAITPTYNQTSTAGATDLLINRTNSGLGSGVHSFADFQVAGASKYRIDYSGCPIPPTFTVSTLPTASTVTRGLAFASNGRKSGEGAAAGTGCLVWSDGTNWRTFYDNSVVAA